MIGAKRVTAPDGTEWRVGRQWLPERPRLWRRDAGGDRGGGDGLLDIGGFDEAFGIVLVLIGIVLVAFLLTTVVFPLIALTLELMLVIVLLVGGIAGRLVFGKPWTIQARSDRDGELTWHASGFRRSGRVRDEVASALALGHTDVRPAEALPIPPGG